MERRDRGSGTRRTPAEGSSRVPGSGSVSIRRRNKCVDQAGDVLLQLITGVNIAIEVRVPAFCDGVITTFLTFNKPVVDEFGESSRNFFTRLVDVVRDYRGRQGEARLRQRLKDSIVNRQLHPPRWVPLLDHFDSKCIASYLSNFNHQLLRYTSPIREKAINTCSLISEMNRRGAPRGRGLVEKRDDARGGTRAPRRSLEDREMGYETRAQKYTLPSAGSDGSRHRFPNSCPTCGDAVGGIAADGPGRRRVVPCGHEIPEEPMNTNSDASGGIDR